MCGRVILAMSAPALRNYCNVPENKDTTEIKYASNYNVKPSTKSPLIVWDRRTNKDNKETGRELSLSTWGLQLPHSQHVSINNRVESIEELSGLKTLFTSLDGRCVVPIEGFYEWSNKEPYVFHPNDTFLSAGRPPKFALPKGDIRSSETLVSPSSKPKAPLLFLAGLVDQSNCYTILTTAAAKHLQWCHHRMPVFLEAKDVDAYLTRKLTIPDIICSANAIANSLQFRKVDNQALAHSTSHNCIAPPGGWGQPSIASMFKRHALPQDSSPKKVKK
eukprot:TRINITY_DN5593_c0_g1_i1.p1 TRINITY_DN5593_c0_g1~~TRINITY_DN5593_c0_g1_i1.p1  ORF type:complete len:299 (+),score=22.41 TRINITY_DN5593_c0_g1_i1:70-897(+)